MSLAMPTLETYRDFSTRFPKGFIDYFFEGALHGDDGKDYFVTFVLSRLEDRDAGRLQVSVEPLWFFTTPSSRVIRRGEKPEIDIRVSNPLGSLTAESSSNELVSRIDSFQVSCSPPTYRLRYDGNETSLDLLLESRGIPFWFNKGKEEGARITPSTVVRGIELFGDMKGSMKVRGKNIRVEGVGIHEHVVSEHIAWMEFGWQDWIWFVFDEMYGLLFEMQGGRYKDGGIYLMREKEYLVIDDFEIDRPEWAYSPVLQHHFPIAIQAQARTGRGSLIIEGKVVRSQPWGPINRYRPAMSMPVSDTECGWKGRFSYDGGGEIMLRDGRGGDEIIALYNFAQSNL